MKSVLKFFRLEFVPFHVDGGLLALRFWLGLTMLIHHGLDKAFNFGSKAEAFPDPIGVGTTASLALATVAEVGGALLLILGLFTRSALVLLIATMGVAFFMTHGAALSGQNSGELAFVYLAGFVALFVSGPGRFSIDRIIGVKGDKRTG